VIEIEVREVVIVVDGVAAAVMSSEIVSKWIVPVGIVYTREGVLVVASCTMGTSAMVMTVFIFEVGVCVLCCAISPGFCGRGCVCVGRENVLSASAGQSSTSPGATTEV